MTTGGPATIMAALRAGVPLVVVPTTWDKPDNARRVVEAGVGVRLRGAAVHARAAAGGRRGGAARPALPRQRAPDGRAAGARAGPRGRAPQLLEALGRRAGPAAVGGGQA